MSQFLLFRTEGFQERRLPGIPCQAFPRLPHGAYERRIHGLDSLPGQLEKTRQQLSDACGQLETAKEEVKKDFPREAEYQEKVQRLNELNALLSVDRDGELPDGKDEEKNAAAQVAEVRTDYSPAPRAKAL